MIVPPAVRRKYSNFEGFVRHVGQEVREILSSYCEEKEYAFVSRFKTVESLAEKIECGRYSTWSKLDDLYAATIVIPTLSDESKVLAFLESQFQQVDLRARGTTQKPPDVFRYDATRFIGRLRESGPISRAPEIDRMPFEVQIRTAFEHAWSVTTHALSYKSDIVDWRRMRLVAQLKAAVEQLDTLVRAFDHSALGVAESPWPDVTARRDISEAFRRCVSQGTIPVELAPKDWSRFSENFQSAIQAASRAGGRRQRPSIEATHVALETIEGDLKAMGPNRIPRSVSLFQLTLGILAKHRLISQFERFVPNVTDELRLLYPEVQGFNPTFNYESSNSDEGSAGGAEATG